MPTPGSPRSSRTSSRETGGHPNPAGETVGAYATRYLALGVGHDGKPLSPTTRELYDFLWTRWLEPTFGDLALGDVSLETVRTWLAQTRAEKNPTSTQPAKAYRLLRTILNVAVDDEKIPANPCRIKGAGKEAAPERPVATEAQVVAIADAIEPQYRALVILGAWCSLRFGELAGMRRSRVDLLQQDRCRRAARGAGRSQDTVESPKSDSAGVVDLPEDIVPILEVHLAEYVGAEPGALLFTSPEGHPLRRTKFRPRWAEACRKAGVTDLHFHDLRGSGATWAAQEDTTLKNVRPGYTTGAQRCPAVSTRHDERNEEIADRVGAHCTAATTNPNLWPMSSRSGRVKSRYST